MKSIHGVGSNFNLENFLKVRDLTIKAVGAIASSVEIGMTEKDGSDLIDRTLNNMGSNKKWHPNKFRIGVNTSKSFSDKSAPNIKLKDNDIFFIDIGPVWQNHEGDHGNTFVLGENTAYQKIKLACYEVFNKTADIWRNEQKTGADLYEFAEFYAKHLGYTLNIQMKGHRIGDFPHHLFYKGGMKQINDIPCKNLWVLEIHLISNNGAYGAFFEDILK